MSSKRRTKPTSKDIEIERMTDTRGRILDEIQTIFLRVFLLVIQSYLYSFALRFILLQSHATSHVFFKFTQPLTYFYSSVYCKLLRSKQETLPYGLRNPYRNLKSENSQDYAQNPSTKLYGHEFGFCNICDKSDRACYSFHHFGGLYSSFYPSFLWRHT